MSAWTIAALLGGEQSRIPEDQRNANILLVQPPPCRTICLCGRPKASLIAGGDDNRVVSEIATAQRREQSSQISIGLSQRVQASLQQFASGSFIFIEKVDWLRVVSQRIGMRLIGPHHGLERASGIGIDPPDQAVDENPIFSSPGACHAYLKLF
jgi:hypothetical protein